MGHRYFLSLVLRQTSPINDCLECVLSFENFFHGQFSSPKKSVNILFSWFVLRSVKYNNQNWTTSTKKDWITFVYTARWFIITGLLAKRLLSIFRFETRFRASITVVYSTNISMIRIWILFKPWISSWAWRYTYNIFSSFLLWFSLMVSCLKLD